MTDSCVLGIDGGGSKTTALLADANGHVVGRGSAGPSNYQVVGLDAACAAIMEAARAACQAARVSLDAPGAVCLGLAGVGRAADRERLLAWAANVWPAAPIQIVNDSELVLAAGTPEGHGLALVCGTGAIALGRNQAGQTGRAGGWGYVLGDEGSSYAIGLAALRAVARAADGRAMPTLLSEAVLNHWRLDAPWGLIERVYRAPATLNDIAALATLAYHAARAGDAAAQQIMDTACAELALALHALAGQLGLSGPTPCALAGGFLINHPAMVEQVLAKAAAHGLALDPVMLVHEPALGAVQIAARLVEDGR